MKKAGNLHDETTATDCVAVEKVWTPRPLPLRDARDVKRLIARLVNEVRRGDIDPRRASCIGYLCNTFLAAHQIADLEARLDVLEKRM
jgi:hypothetical protein